MSGNIVFRLFPSIAIRYGLTVVTFQPHTTSSVTTTYPQDTNNRLRCCGGCYGHNPKEERYIVYMNTEEHVLRVQELPGGLEPQESDFRKLAWAPRASFRKSRSSGLGVCECVGADVRTLYLTGYLTGLP
jgi:hypothetical protein